MTRSAVGFYQCRERERESKQKGADLEQEMNLGDAADSETQSDIHAKDEIKHVCTDAYFDRLIYNLNLYRCNDTSSVSN